jgi:hypothetical protein
MQITKKEKRIIQCYLKCKVAEEGCYSRQLKMGDCWDIFMLGKELGLAEAKAKLK